MSFPIPPAISIGYEQHTLGTQLFTVSPSRPDVPGEAPRGGVDPTVILLEAILTELHQIRILLTPVAPAPRWWTRLYTAWRTRATVWTWLTPRRRR